MAGSDLNKWTREGNLVMDSRGRGTDSTGVGG